nr:hypothetical protein [Rickettsia endosymbiont of Ceutorhynchus assimilis]
MAQIFAKCSVSCRGLTTASSLFIKAFSGYRGQSRGMTILSDFNHPREALPPRNDDSGSHATTLTASRNDNSDIHVIISE